MLDSASHFCRLKNNQPPRTELTEGASKITGEGQMNC